MSSVVVIFSTGDSSTVEDVSPEFILEITPKAIAITASSITIFLAFI